MSKFSLFWAFVASIGGFLFGYDTGIIAGILPFMKMQLHLSTSQAEGVVSTLIIGAFLSSSFSGLLCNTIGRKRTLLMTAIIFIIGTLLCANSHDVSTIYLGRFILGIAVGICSYASPLYIAEISPIKHRGKLVLCNGIMITFGEMLAYAINCFFTSTQNWHAMFLSAMIPSLLLLLGVMLIPETPRYLVKIGASAKANLVLQKSDKSLNQFAQSRELQGIVESIKQQKQSKKINYNKKTVYLLLIGILLGIFQQFSGINAILYYGPYIFKQVGFASGNQQIVATFFLGTCNFIGTLVCVLLVDKVGRKKLLLSGTAMAAMSLFIFSSLYHVQMVSAQQAMLALLCMVIFIFGYAISIGSLFWLIIAEIYPLNIRAQAMGIAAGIQWIANLALSSSFLWMLEYFRLSYIFNGFATICLCCFIFVFFNIKETKGKSLEFIEKNYLANKPS